MRSSLLGRYFGTNYHFRIGRDANSKSLIDSNSKKTASQMVNSGPGAEMLSRAGVTLCEMQGRLDKCGASDLIIDLIMVQPNLRVFLEILELAIALLEGGNNSIQVGNYLGSQEFYDFGHEKGDVCDHVTTRLLPTHGLSVRGPYHSRLASLFSCVRSGNQRFLLRLIIFRIFPYFSLLKKSLLHRFTNGKCEEFFRYIYDKMRDAEAEIRATITVQTTESTVAKKSDKDVSHAKTADGRRGTVFGGRRDTLIAGQRQNRKS